MFVQMLSIQFNTQRFKNGMKSFCNNFMNSPNFIRCSTNQRESLSSGLAFRSWGPLPPNLKTSKIHRAQLDAFTSTQDSHWVLVATVTSSGEVSFTKKQFQVFHVGSNAFVEISKQLNQHVSVFFVFGFQVFPYFSSTSPLEDMSSPIGRAICDPIPATFRSDGIDQQVPHLFVHRSLSCRRWEKLLTLRGEVFDSTNKKVCGNLELKLLLTYIYICIYICFLLTYIYIYMCVCVP